MQFERADGPLARAFERELKRHHGRIGATEIALGYHRGHFSRLFRYGHPIKVDLILKALAHLGVEARDFFAQAYDVSLIPEVQLSLHARPQNVDSEIKKIEKAVLALENEDPPEPSQVKPRDFRPRLETFWRDGAAYQRKYLRTIKMFRQVAFVSAYLERLDALRYEKPKDAAKVAAGVVTILLPLVPGKRKELIALACKAIGIFASGHRQSLGFETAAAALVMGLRLAGRHGLELERAELLQRGAYVLADRREFDRALKVLHEAHIIYFDCKNDAGIAKVTVERATMFGHKGDHEKALSLFKEAHQSLPDEPCFKRYRIAAMDGVTISHRALGDLDAAEAWLQRAIDSHGDEEDVTWGRTIWQAAAIAFEKGNYTRAEELLGKTRDVFEEKGNPIQAGLAALDHTSVLLSQGKQAEAGQLAISMASLLKPFQYNPHASSAITEFFRAGLEGCLTLSLIQATAKKLKEDVPETGHTLFSDISNRQVRHMGPRKSRPSRGTRRLRTGRHGNRT